MSLWSPTVTAAHVTEKWLVVKNLLVRLKQVPEGWRWVVVRWGRYCAVWRSLSCVCCVCVQFCAWCLSLFGISFPVFAGEIDALYPLRPCSSATRSLKLFLFSFPGGINSPIFSAHQKFSPILLQHRLCLLGCLSVSLPDRDLSEPVVCIWHISGLF